MEGNLSCCFVECLNPSKALLVMPKVITSKESVGVFLESKHSFFLEECLLGNMSEHLPSPQLLCGGPPWSKTVIVTWLKYISIIYKNIYLLYMNLSPKQSWNRKIICLFSYTSLKPFAGFLLFSFPVSILYIRSKCLVFDFCSQPAFVMLPICPWESSFQWAKWCSYSVPGMTTAADISGRAIGVWKAFLFCRWIMSRLSAAFNHTSGFT